MYQKMTSPRKILGKPLAASFILVIASVIFIGSKATTQSTDVQKKFDINFKKWSSKNLENYRYTFSRTCFCPIEYAKPVVISVRNGAINAVRYVDSGEPVNESRFKDYGTINDLFNTIQQAIKQKAQTIEVKYDSEFGYPREASIDLDKNIADEEIFFSAKNLIVEEKRK